MTQAQLKLGGKNKPKVVKCTAHEIRVALRDYFSAPAHALLEEVRNRTGYGRVERYADAIVGSLWPSRGLWFGGIEIKVARSDWKKELEDPNKSAEIQRFCRYWWIAAPVGLVHTGELPQAWGLLEFDGKRLACAKEAPELSPEDPTLPFMMSILRNVSKSQQAALDRAHADGRASAESERSQQRVDELEGQLRREKAQRDADQHLLKKGTEAIQELSEMRRLLGVYGYDPNRWGAAKRNLEALQKFMSLDLPRKASELRNAAGALDAVLEGTL